MGVSGPVGKRSDQRVRRNKNVPVDKIEAAGPVDAPELGLTDPHPIVVDLYAALPESAETQYWEPSDWQWARVQCHFLSQLLWSRKPSAQMLQTISSAMSDLLITEGSRRRVRLEIERSQSEGQLIDVAALFRKQMEQAGTG